jgi:hypothetical protein
MSDTRGLQALHNLVDRESRSLMQYMLGAFPWTTANKSAAVARLLGMTEAERDALVPLTRYLHRHKMPPPRAGGYPVDFTSLNFVDLDFLAALLARHQEDSIARLKDDLAAVSDDEGRRLAHHLLELKTRHLADLRRLTQPEPAVMP